MTSTRKALKDGGTRAQKQYEVRGHRVGGAVQRASTKPTASSSKSLDDYVWGIFSLILGVITKIIQGSIYLVGGIGLPIVDVMLGAQSLSIIFKHSTFAFGYMFSPTALANVMSPVTSVVQMIIWRLVFSKKIPKGIKFLFLIPGIAIMILDTGIDTSLTKFLVYGASPLENIPDKPVIYWFVWGLILLLTGFNEALFNMMGFVAEIDLRKLLKRNAR